MSTEKKEPLHRRARAHVRRVAGVCNARCRQWRVYDRLLPTGFLIGVLLFLIYSVTISPPLDFPSASLVKISPGMSLAEVGVELQSKHIIHSVLLFELIAKIYGNNTQGVPGEYFFPGPENIITVAKRLARGDFELIPVRVTIPEGTSTTEIGAILGKKLADFDTATFLVKSQTEEGYLFPDTYFFLPGENPDTVLAVLETNFTNHIGTVPVQEALLKFGKPLNQVITMASLLEKEASDTKDRRIIAGILWKRISIGMPLQVDAVFPYILDKSSLQLTRADLQVDSPYNTYTNKGLPPGPITNPGLDAILDAMTPTKTNYLYYLSDLNGNFHYSATYAGQLANQKKYLQ